MFFNLKNEEEIPNCKRYFQIQRKDLNLSNSNFEKKKELYIVDRLKKRTSLIKTD